MGHSKRSAFKSWRILMCPILKVKCIGRGVLGDSQQILPGKS